ncbi:MAG TPA: response regulator [Gemmataceae bacterium]|jgi:CheY-like chemotaxis protein|nr:response regulator [Gemmataceae bacterium]
MSKPSSPGLPRVLVVEPDADIRRMLSAAFRRWGVTAHFASDGPSAVDLCRQHAAIGLVLLEVSLPEEMDGPATLNAILAIRPGLRCWFVGGHGGRYNRQQLMACGAEGLLPKPFDLKSLRKLLGRPSIPPPRPMPGAERRTVRLLSARRRIKSVGGPPDTSRRPAARNCRHFLRTNFSDIL